MEQREKRFCRETSQKAPWQPASYSSGTWCNHSKRIAKGFGSTHHDATVGQTLGTQAAPSSTVDSSTDAGYDPKKPQLQKSTVISPILEGTPGSTPTRTEVQTEGISLISHVFQRVDMSPANITNLLCISLATGQHAIAPLHPKDSQLGPQISTTESVTVTISITISSIPIEETPSLDERMIDALLEKRKWWEPEDWSWWGCHY